MVSNTDQPKIDRMNREIVELKDEVKDLNKKNIELEDLLTEGVQNLEVEQENVLKLTE